MSKRVHILGICGTFMGGVALLASSATPPMKVPQIPSMCTRLDIKRSKMQR